MELIGVGVLPIHGTTCLVRPKFSSTTQNHTLQLFLTVKNSWYYTVIIITNFNQVNKIIHS